MQVGQPQMLHKVSAMQVPKSHTLHTLHVTCCTCCATNW